MSGMIHMAAFAAPITRLGFAIERLETVRTAIEQGDLLAAFRQADSFTAVFSALMADLVQEAYDAGHTKAAIARALGVPPSTFRGLVKS